MTEGQFRRDLADLQTRLAIHDARVMANPKLYLKRMQDHCTELLKVLDRLDRALSPDIVFDKASEMNIPPAIFCGGDLVRVTAAKKVLKEYKRGRR